MAGVISHTTLFPQVLEAIDAFVNSQPKGKFSDFKLPNAFVEQCMLYLKCSPPPCGNTASRFDLPFECFVQYNYYKEPRGEEFNEQVIKVYADPEEIGGWQNAIRCLQRYCFNLLLAPKRKDFHYIKLSNAYYQYNIAKSFKGAEKIMEAMGYKVVNNGGKPHYQVLTMQLSGNPDRKKVAKLVVDLVLFDLELRTIHECIMLHNKQHPNNHCSVKDALEARTKTKGGVQEAKGYLWQMLKGKSGEAVGKFSNKSIWSQPKNPHDQHGTASSGAISESGDFQTPNASPATSRNINATQSGSRKESSFPRIDPTKDLPPPDIDDPSVNFTSVHHTNPSSEFDDDGLIPESTHLGYRNPPESKHNPLAGHGPIADPQISAGGCMLSYTQTTVTPASTNYPPPMVVSSHERNRFNQFDQNQQKFGHQYNFLQGGTQQDHLRGSSGSSGGLHSMPTSSIRPTAENTRTGEFQSINNQLAPTKDVLSSRMFNRQKSMSDSGETIITFTTPSTVTPASAMAATTTSTANVTVPAVYTNVPGDHESTTIGNQSTSTNTTNTTNPPVLYGNVPVEEPVSNANTVSESITSSTSTAPKHGKLNLDDIRRKTKQATGNLNVQVSQHNKQDVSSAKKHLDQKKETRAQVEGMNVKPVDYSQPRDAERKSSSDYSNIDDFSPSARPAVRIDIPANKRPAPAPRYNKDHLTPSGERFEHWRCAYCEVVNEAKRTNCKKCMVVRGTLAVSHAFCGLCNLLVYISEEKFYSAIACPMCKEEIHSGV